MLGHIKLIERGPTPRKLKKAMNAAQKAQWAETGAHFHGHMREARFTPEHAAEANYLPRSGEKLARGSKRFKRSYTGRKLSRFGHTRPLEFTGEARRLSRMANVSSTSRGARVRYPGLRKFNFRHPQSQIRMNEEFRRVTKREAEELAKVHDRGLDQKLNATP